jgi:hypothetical protein
VNTARRRGLTGLVALAGLAMGLGALAAKLRPTPATGPRIPGAPETELPAPDVAMAALVAGAEARMLSDAGSQRGGPEFDALVVTCRRGEDKCAPVLAAAESASPALRTALAEALPRVGWADARALRLLEPSLRDDHDALADRAATILRARGQLALGVAAGCACTFGGLRLDGDTLFVAAFASRADAGLMWDARVDGAGGAVELRIEPRTDGADLLRAVLPVGRGAFRVVPFPGAEAVTIGPEVPR